MYKLVIVDENQVSYEFEGDYIDERYTNSTQRQTLSLVRMTNMTNEFVSSFAPLYNVNIESITVYHDGTELIKYTEYNVLESVMIHYPPDITPILQGSVIFLKQ